MRKWPFFVFGIPAFVIGISSITTKDGGTIEEASRIIHFHKEIGSDK